MVECRFWNPKNQQKFSIKKWFILRCGYDHSIGKIGRGMGKSSTQVGGEGDCTGDVVVPRKGIDPLAKFESLLMAANETMRTPNL